MPTPKRLGDLLVDDWGDTYPAADEHEAFGCASCRFGLQPSPPQDVAKMASVTCPRGHTFTLRDRLAIWTSLFMAAGYDLVRAADAMTEAGDHSGRINTELYDLAEVAQQFF